MGVYKRGRKFWITYTVRGKQQFESAGHDRRLAERLLEQRRAQVLLGEFAPKARQVRLKQYTKEYLAWAKAKKASWRRDKSSIVHLERHLGDLFLTEIRHSVIERYQQVRAQEMTPKGGHPTPATINREVTCLTKLLSLAKRDRIIAEHPARGVGRLPEHNERTRVVNDDELETLLGKASPWLRAVIIVGAETAMRANELATLTWAEVDLKAGFIRLASHQTKNRTARAVPLSEPAIEALKALPRPIRGGRVFTRKRGKPLADGGSISSAFRDLKKKVGLPDIWFHDFRRTRATRWRRDGHDYFRIMKATGHKTMAVFKRYNPVEDDELLALVKRSPSDQSPGGRPNIPKPGPATAER